MEMQGITKALRTNEMVMSTEAVCSYSVCSKLSFIFLVSM